MDKEDQNWLPLESNPQVINSFLTKLGLTPLYAFQEVLSIEEWALQMIPRPVLGVLFLFKDSKIQQSHKEKESVDLKPEDVPSNVFFMKQYAHNACGTIGLFHIICNALENYPFIVQEQSYIHKFREENLGQSAQKIGEHFKKNKGIMVEHKQAVNKGQTKVKSRVDSHFIAFVSKNGRLYELDGCKKCAVDHGACEEDDLMMRSAQIISKFMQRDPTNLHFSMMALCPNQNDW